MISISVQQARPLLTRAVEQENYDELIDPRLETNYDAYDMARLIACAAAAVRQTARSRPRMTQVNHLSPLPKKTSPAESSGGSKPDQTRRHSQMARSSGTWRASCRWRT